MKPEEVKEIFNITNKLYKSNIDNELFKVIVSYMFTVDKDIFNSIVTDEYNLYQKYKACWSDIEWNDLIHEAKNIDDKFHNDFAYALTNQILNIIEETFKSK